MTGRRHVLSNALVVAPDRVIAGGTVVVEDGLIVEVGEATYPTAAETIDLGGRWLLPGLVDLHNDAIEREINPRPGAELDPTFALLQLDRKLAAAGVTTQFHAVSFAERDAPRRSVEFATALCDAIGDLRLGGEATITHHALLRLDLRTAPALDALLAALDRAAIPLVSLNDHVPGQGQYRDLAAYRRYISRDFDGKLGEAGIDALVDEGLRRAAATEHLVTETLARLAVEGRGRSLILVSHDDDSPERIDAMRELGCAIAEFPLTIAAAERAAARGMRIAMGAANALRGGSLTGNASALDLLRRGLVDVLVADYYAPALLAAIFHVVALGLADLPAATRLVSLNPATAVGLGDRGAVVAGRRADLVVVDRSGRVPLPFATMVGGEWRYAVAPVSLRTQAAAVVG